ncbi:MAG: hypothetical protein COA78_05210 [Blastopirellula sp.]|nr:MAG: hypothetical protein COA78_05210 [Blastopirellula sp.]
MLTLSSIYDSKTPPTDINQVLAALCKHLPGRVEIVAEDAFEYEKKNKIRTLDELEKQGKSMKHKDFILTDIDRKKDAIGPGKILNISCESMQTPAVAIICARSIHIHFEEHAMDCVEFIQGIIEPIIGKKMSRNEY